MGQLQRQAFRKAYSKIWDLTTAEVPVEAIASLTQYYDQPLRCFTFEDFQLVDDYAKAYAKKEARGEGGRFIAQRGGDMDGPFRPYFGWESRASLTTS